MSNAEPINLVFDRDDIDETGLDIALVAGVAAAFQDLSDHILKAAAMSSGAPGASVGTMKKVVELRVLATPFAGSLKVPLSFTITVGALTVLANASQVTGVTLRDVFATIRHYQHHDNDARLESGSVAAIPGAQNRVESLLKTAAGTGCSYVAVEWGNQRVVLHGGEEARFSFIASQPGQGLPGRFNGVTVVGAPSRVERVYYRGRAYDAFAVNSSGAPYKKTGMVGETPAAVILWGSKRSLEPETTYSVQSQEVTAGEVSHGADLPTEFRLASKVFLVVGASPVSYE